MKLFQVYEFDRFRIGFDRDDIEDTIERID